MGEGEQILVKALERRKRALQEVEDIDAFLATYAALAGVPIETLLGGGQSVASPGAALTPIEDAPARKSQAAAAVEADDPGAGMPQREFTTLAKELLLAHGRPMQSHPLLNAFHEIGRRVGGRDELRNLTTKLWRAQAEITKVPGAGYWPRDVACPAVRYVPPGAGERREQKEPAAQHIGGVQPAVDQQTSVAPSGATLTWEPTSGSDLDDEIPF